VDARLFFICIFMAKTDISKFTESQLADLVNARWESSSEPWDIVERVYKQNTRIYANQADWVQLLPYNRKQWAVHANRIFVNMESVINSLIANPPGINVLPSRDGQIAQDFARKLESFFRKKYVDLNIKETMRMGYRNLYFGRLIVIKAFWNPTINDFDYRAVDPRKVRFGKYSRKEQDSEFAIEEIEDNLCAVIERFPAKKTDLMKKYGIADDAQLYIRNPDVKYKEAWIGDHVVFKIDNIILDTIKNPYWDWDGILITEEEEQQLEGSKDQPGLEGDARRQALQQIKLQQDQRQAEMKAAQAVSQQAAQQNEIAGNPRGTPGVQGAPDVENPAEAQVETQPTPPQYKPYYFNYFDNPRKPYIFATIFNNKNTPIGRTDMITLSAELQRGIDKRKMDIDENCELVNGIIKVDASVMGKSDAQRIRFETKGIIWGKGVKDGVTRETGAALPQMVFEDMQDSRSEIDNIMAATSAFRGERQGQETKAGRLALVQQSYLRLNELVQLGDFVAKEIFDWGMQLAKTRYTEYHYAKWMGKEGAREVIELIQDDFETGSEVKIIAGKQLPVDEEFKFEQAQKDVQDGFLSPVDYLEIAQYDNAKDLAKNAVTYKINPGVAVNISPEEMATLQPQKTEEKPPNISINYADLPPDAQVQLLDKIGIKADPQIIVAEKMAEQAKSKQDMQLKADAQAHGQKMAERSQIMAEQQVNANPDT
jgi:hypothetical protein